MSEQEKVLNEEKPNGEQNVENAQSVIQDESMDMPGSENSDSSDAGHPSGESDSAESEKSGPRLFRRDQKSQEFSRDKWILTHLSSDNLMEYLKLEQKREELLAKSRETKQKRILSAFQLFISLAAVVGIIWLLRDNPSVMVNILYIIGIIGALWIWKNPHSKQD